MVEAEASVEACSPLGRPPFEDARRVGGGLGWSVRGLEAGDDGRAPEGSLERLFAAAPERTLRVVPGRATFVWPADAGVVVKRFEGGSVADAWHDWRRMGLARSPGRREAENLRELAACGLPVPRAFGWCEERSTWPAARTRRSGLWMERVAHAETLRQLAERAAPAAVERWLDELARLVARLHLQGWFHRDLYLEHWIVAGERLVLLDVGRARREVRPRERWFVKDVAALLHSCPSAVGTRARLRFLARYLDLRGVGERAARRDFARKVLAKRRRIAAHAPRFVDRTRPT